MPVTITPEQRKVLVRCKLRPTTLKQYYAVRSLLALGKGSPGYGNDSRQNGPLPSQARHTEVVARAGARPGRNSSV
jgi:hypothetical protein